LGYFMPLEQYTDFLFHRPFDHLYEMVVPSLFVLIIASQSIQMQAARTLVRRYD